MTYLIYIKHIEFSIYVIDYCKKSSKLPPYIYITECILARGTAQASADGRDADGRRGHL